MRLQLTAFGARDRWFFEVILCRAPCRQLKRSTLGGKPSKPCHAIMFLKLYQYRSTFKRVTIMWRDQVLRSPKLYLGHEWNTDGLHGLVLEIIRLAADPHAANDSTTVATTLRHDGSLLVEDDGVASVFRSSGRGMTLA